MGTSLRLLSKMDSEKAMEIAKGLENENSSSIRNLISSIYAKSGTKENHLFFISAVEKASGFGKYGLLNSYKIYLRNLDEKDLTKSHKAYKDVAKNETTWWIKMLGYNGLSDTKNKYTNRISQLETKLSTTKDMMEKSKIEREINYFRTSLNEVNDIYNTLKSEERNTKVLEYLEK